MSVFHNISLFRHGPGVFPAMTVALSGVFLMLFFLIVPLSSAMCDVQVQGTIPGTAVKGIADFSRVDFTRSGAVKLDGEWEFYWKKLYGPEDFTKQGFPVPDRYYQVPRFWTGYGDKDYSARGFATYRLLVKTGEYLGPLSIQTPELFSEYKLWIDGKIIDQHGSFIDKAVRFLKPDVFSFPCHGGTAEIVLQIKNSS
ncbi:MAG TPA: hypothetical protein PLI62_11770, partial [Spirochaetota bacterium]|nr:hypothetical protein [Spirochaetota bacterium]